MNVNQPPRPKAVVLLSGGLDSSTVLAIAEDLGFEACAMTFRYGQRHDLEVNAARAIAAKHGVKHHAFVDIDLPRLWRFGPHGEHRRPEGPRLG